MRHLVLTKDQFEKTLTAIGEHARACLLPLVGILVFLLAWTGTASQVETSLGQFPGPAQVAQQFFQLYSEHQEEREKESAFYERQEKRNAARLTQDPDYTARIRPYTGKETFLDQIATSLGLKNAPIIRRGPPVEDDAFVFAINGDINPGNRH